MLQSSIVPNSSDTNPSTFETRPIGAASKPIAPDGSAGFPLIMAGDGERVRIQRLHGGKGLTKRLTELGLNQGTEIRIVQRQGAGLLVARGETRIALGGGMAAKILVIPLGT